MRFIVVPIAGAVLASCATSAPPETQADFAERTRESYDYHSDMRTVLGHRFRDYQPFDEDADWLILSQAIGGHVQHQAYVTVSCRSDWAFYYRAASNGRALEFVQIDRSVSTCSTNPCTLRETFAATIPEDLLATGAKHGLTIRFYARDGYVRDAVYPAEYIQAQIAAIETADN